jgi:hypothetical protein
MTKMMITMALLSSSSLFFLSDVGIVDAFLATPPAARPASFDPPPAAFASHPRGLRCPHAVSNDVDDAIGNDENDDNDDDDDNDENEVAFVSIVDDPLGRRSSTMRIVSSVASTLAFASSSSLSLSPRAAAAATSSSSSSDLFRPNPLTNPLLERIRIWDQDEADNIVYGGELASPYANKGGGNDVDVYVALMQPILDVECDLRRLNALLESFDGRRGGGKGNDDDVVVGRLLDDANELLTNPKFDKLPFKKSFNAFADNIYYTDPDRANLYLGGGALPRNSQSNEILTNVEDMRAEVAYLIRVGGTGRNRTDGNGNNGGGDDDDGGGIDLDELRRLCKSANEGIGRYVDLVPPGELEAARAVYARRLG